MQVGFIGLGTMGLPMARRLLGAGYVVHCSSRSLGPVRTLGAEGAIAHTNANEVIASADVSFLCLPDDSAVRSVLDPALADSVLKGRLIVNCSTVSPSLERVLHTQTSHAGGSYLDAPVSGGPAGAKAGNLAIMVGGDGAAFTRAEPLLTAMGSWVRLVGGPGAGQVVKLCCQSVVGAQLLAIAESLEFARRSAIDPAALQDALVHSTADCVMARTRFPEPDVLPGSPASNGWRPDFMTFLMAKDVGLASDAMAQQEIGSTALGRLAELLAVNTVRGAGGLDWSSFAELLRR
jgi:3-hydroxyisobutyrate dehydrogenase-like beta-hydroxyacid dehydrogenase